MHVQRTPFDYDLTDPIRIQRSIHWSATAVVIAALWISFVILIDGFKDEPRLSRAPAGHTVWPDW